MDARKAKSRAAIVSAFSELLCEEDYGKITVGDIIARARVGRATFYGLFKSKDDLLVRARDAISAPMPSTTTVRPSMTHSYRSSISSATCGIVVRAYGHWWPAPARASSQTAFARPSWPEQPRPYPSTRRAQQPPWTGAFSLHHIASSFVGMVQWWAWHNFQARQSRRSQRLPLSHKTPLRLSKKLVPKHRPNPGRHASQSLIRASKAPPNPKHNPSQSIDNSPTPLPATSPSHPNSDIYVGLLVRTQPRPRSWPHGVTSQRIPQDAKRLAARSAQRAFLHVRGRAGKSPHAASGQLCSLGLEHAQETMHKQRGQSGTDKRSNARNEQAVLPVVVGLVLDRQHLIGHARTKVTSLVHGEAGDAAHAHANSPNDQTDADSEHQNVLAGAVSSSKDGADEHKGADSLAEEVAGIVRTLGGGVGREDIALGNGVDDAIRKP